MTDNARKLFEFISQHPELSNAVTEATDIEQIISFAAEYGITVTKEDFEQPDKQGIDENEPAAVAGGKACGALWAEEENRVTPVSRLARAWLRD